MTTTPLPSSSLSTTGNISEPPTAHRLIKEITMTFTGPLRFAVLAPALVCCVASVGDVGGPGKPPRDTDGKCTKVDHDVDFTDSAQTPDDVPSSGCWELVGYSLTIRGSDVTSLAKLGNLASVDHLTIDGTKLTAIDFAKTVKVYAGLTVTGNTGLTNLKNIVLEAPDHDIVIDNNPELVTLDGVADVTSIGGTAVLSVTNNLKLATAKFSKLISINGPIELDNNYALTAFDISGLSRSKELYIANNAMLTAIAWPHGKIDGYLTVASNSSLAALPKADQINEINGSVVIEANPKLTSVAVLKTGLSVYGNLTIRNNNALTTLEETSHIGMSSGTITITGNTALNNCAATEVGHCVNMPTATLAPNKQGTPTTGCNCWCGR